MLSKIGTRRFFPPGRRACALSAVLAALGSDKFQKE